MISSSFIAEPQIRSCFNWKTVLGSLLSEAPIYRSQELRWSKVGLEAIESVKFKVLVRVFA